MRWRRWTLDQDRRKATDSGIDTWAALAKVGRSALDPARSGVSVRDQRSSGGQGPASRSAGILGRIRASAPVAGGLKIKKSPDQGARGQSKGQTPGRKSKTRHNGRASQAPRVRGTSTTVQAFNMNTGSSPRVAGNIDSLPTPGGNFHPATGTAPGSTPDTRRIWRRRAGSRPSNALAVPIFQPDRAHPSADRQS